MCVCEREREGGGGGEKRVCVCERERDDQHTVMNFSASKQGQCPIRKLPASYMNMCTQRQRVFLKCGQHLVVAHRSS